MSLPPALALRGHGLLLVRRAVLGWLLLCCGPLAGSPTDRCGGALGELGELQGEGNGPRQHQQVTIVGVVTLVTADALGPGFYLQSTRSDGNPHSSGGLFVLASEGSLHALAPGHRVRVRGRVAELEGRTTLTELELLERCGSAALEPTDVALSDAEEVGHLDGMLVRSTETWTLIDTAQLESSGRVLISAHGRSYAAGHPLGQEPRRHWELSGLAEGLGSWLEAGTVSEHLRLGARVSGLTALVDAGSPPRLLSSSPLGFRAEPTPPAPARSPNTLRVAGLNLHNYFSALGSRGARNELELERQRAKLVSLLQQLDADVLALSELGNQTEDGASSVLGGTSLADLLSALDAASAGQLAYRVSERTDSPRSPLRSAIAYRSGPLQPAGDAWFANHEAFTRAPLVQRFGSTGGDFTIVVVHLKSKLCTGAAEVVGPDGCGAQQRLDEASALLRLLSELPASEAESTLVLGDFNADALEAPLRELRAGGLLDLLGHVPAAERYSYVFEGRASQLDHALGGPALAARLRGAQLWHINADEPALLGYELEHAARAYAPDARRASDHDPLIIDLAQ